MSAFTRIAALLLFPIFATLTCAGQQTFWGTASQGGTYGQGTLFTVTNTGTFSKKYDFQRYNGAAPRAEMIKATNGLYYGTTRNGGSVGLGALYSYDPATGAYTVLVNFTGTATGTSPEGGVIQASNGSLYGLCRTGGTGNLGTLWQYNISTSTFNKRVDFTGAANGSNPVGRPVEVSVSGVARLFYVTNLGGANSVGAIGDFQLSNNTNTRRFSFASATGSKPLRGMTLATNGLLYGTTGEGGSAANVGVLYSFNPASPFTYTSLFAMAVATGSVAVGELVQATDGHLYGVTTAGGNNLAGAIFRYNIAGASYTKLFDMAAATGRVSYSRMRQASNGLLYGMTNLGGANDQGVLFSFDPAGPTYTVLKDLSTTTGGNPFSSVMEDPVGTLVGHASTGGSGSNGVLFKYVIATTQMTTLIPFGYSTGANPWCSPVRASDGKFYGVASAGGSSDGGVIYSFDPATSTYAKLVDLGGANGRYPYGRVYLLNNKLYGLCNQGGTSSTGTLFEYDIASQVYTVKINFNTTTGFRPLAGMTLGDDGLLYGNTTEGGTFGYGTFFQYDPATNGYVILKQHRAQDGTMPVSDPFKASNGIIYGTLSESSVLGAGSIYQYNPTLNIYAKIFDMTAINGGGPSGALCEATNGKLYGLSSGGGANSSGVVFSWTINTSTYTNEYDLTAAQGSSSESGLIAGNAGSVYGTCLEGGANTTGSIIKYDPVADAVTVLRSLAANGSDGIYPYDGLSSDVIPAPPNNVVKLSVKAFLEGPYNSGTGLMNDALRSLGTFPLTEPFTAAGFTLVGGGGETIAASVLSPSGNDAIVDWVLLELRDKNNNATVLRSKSALVQRDGDIVDLDGISPVSMPMAADLYYVAVRHRNHLGVLTSSTFSLTSTTTAIDLTDGGVATFGTDAQKIVGSARVSWAGNVFRDASLKYTGAGNDRDPILVRIGGTVPTNTTAGYWPEDVNLDGVVKYIGSSNDRDPILVNVGGTIPTNTRTEQLP